MYTNTPIGHNQFQNILRGGVAKFRENPFGYVEKSVYRKNNTNQKCGPMPNVMAALPNIGGALCSTPQRLADAQYWSAVQ